MEVTLVTKPIKKSELVALANEGFGDVIKAAVDIEKSIMALGGELHSDEQLFLTEKAGSKWQDVWGINIYPSKSEDDWIEFDSMINLKPTLNNRSRGVENPETKKIIKEIVKKLVAD